MKISKVTVDEFIGKTKRYLGEIRICYFSGSTNETLQTMCNELFDDADETFGSLHGCAVYDILVGMCRVKPDIANEDIYKVLEVLGYEVTE